MYIILCMLAPLVEARLLEILEKINSKHHMRNNPSDEFFMRTLPFQSTEDMYSIISGTDVSNGTTRLYIIP